MLGVLVLAAVVLGVAGDAPDWMVAKDKQFSDLFNSGNYSGVAGLYNPGAELIPPTADQFILQPALAAFFENAAKMVKNLSLTPLHTMQESDTLWHEIGQVVDSAEKGLYYVRWVKVNNDWQMAFDCMAIGAKPSNRPLRTSLSDIPDWLQAQDKTFADKFNSGDFAGLQALYNPGAQLIPPTADEFLKQPQIGAFFQGAAKAGMKNLVLHPLVAYAESPTLVHELGQYNSTAGGHHYYTRWINNQGTWQIAFDIMAAGMN